jgi:hypothetical protein
MLFRRVLLVVAASLALLVAVDVGLSVFALRDGEFLGRPVPPYGDVREARWQAWAQHRMPKPGVAAEAPQALRHDPHLGWANTALFASADGRLRFNSKGLRGAREHDDRPAAGRRRIAMFGESFIYGEEVADGDEFAAQLEQLDPSLEVLNFGVSGYGTDQALMHYLQDGVGQHAEVACIGVMLENIVRNVSRLTRLRNPYVKGLGIKPRLRWVDGQLLEVPSPYPSESAVCEAVLAGTLPDDVRAFDAFAELPYDSWIWKSSLARLYMGWSGSRARDYRRAWRDEAGEAFQVTLAILSEFDARARADGASRTLVIIFPPKEDLALHLDGGDIFWSGLERALSSRGIESLDVSPALAARAREMADGVGDATQIAARVFLRAHLNRAGNAVVARELERRLNGPAPAAAK